MSERLELTNDNYFSKEANMQYMSVSQFKDFEKCEVEALDKLNGLIEDEKGDAMIFGGYIDAFFSGELDQYLEQNKDRLINSKTGEFKAPFKNIPEVINAITSDDFFYKFHKGKPQVIYTGEIAGVPVKGKLDFDFEELIVDQKVMKDFLKIWNEEQRKKLDFIETYGYDVQGGVYQELKRQKTNKKVPFVIAATTKEESPDKALIQIDQYYLDKGLQRFIDKAPRYQRIKMGEIPPVGCGHCPSCRRRKKLTEIVMYSQFFDKVIEDETDGRND